jgi:uncharacterized protein (UPF0248 family)
VHRRYVMCCCPPWWYYSVYEHRRAACGVQKARSESIARVAVRR